LKSCCFLQDHYDDECDKIVFQNTTPDLQDQDRSVQNQDQDQDRFFWSQTGLVLRPTVSDHITAAHIHVYRASAGTECRARYCYGRCVRLSVQCRFCI